MTGDSPLNNLIAINELRIANSIVGFAANMMPPVCVQTGICLDGF
jgi:hypothetical protein